MNSPWQIGIKCDPGLVPLAAPRQHPIRTNIIAPANTAVAENTGLVIGPAIAKEESSFPRGVAAWENADS